MPIFRKGMGKDEKQLFDKKFQMAQEKPDEFFDLTNCGIRVIPDKVYAYCKVLQKKVMLLQYNRINSLNNGKMEELITLQVLDLSNNEIVTLPKQIKLLVHLQKLDLSFNKIKQLPEEIGCLIKLHSLKLKGNKLTFLPPSIKQLRELEILDVSQNKDLAQLPVNLCYLSSLEEFYYDKERIRYPPKEVSNHGILEIKRWFMLIKGDEFEEEMAALKARLPDRQADHSSSSLSDEGASDESIRRREEKREKKRLQHLELEKRIQDAQTENAMLLSAATSERQKVLANVAFEEMRNQSEIHRAYEECEGSRAKLLQALRHDEEYLNDTVSLVLQMTEKSRRTEELLDELEAERERTDMLFKVTQEETERLKKEEVIRCMTIVMEELEKHEIKFAEYEKSRDYAANLALRSFNESNQDVETLLVERDEHRADLLHKIANEEDSQMQVFKALQFQKDSKLTRIRQQIELIESELKRISLLEMEKKIQKEGEEMDRLAEMRINTAVILSQLIDEQEKREAELVKRLKEMEDYRQDEAKDYWLVQFQRLLDSKPQVLIDDENALDIAVVEILANANAKEYLPMFARRKITKEQMHLMTHDELKSIGVYDDEARTNILAVIKSTILMSHEMEQKQTFKKSLSCDASEESVEMTPSAPPAASLIARFEGECVVCMEEKPDTIFLNCGHVCTCGMCSRPLDICPLCRQEIVQKCHLFGV